MDNLYLGDQECTSFLDLIFPLFFLITFQIDVYHKDLAVAFETANPRKILGST